MVAGIGLRTVWISLRAMNYTDRAFRETVSNTEGLRKAEKKHIETLLDQRRAIMANISAGMLYTVMGVTMMAGIYNLAQSTKVGAEYMKQFSATMGELKTQFADAFFVTLKPALDVLQMFVGIMKQYPIISRLIASLAVFAIVVMTLVGIHKLWSASIQLVSNNMAINAILQKGLRVQTTATGIVAQGAAISWRQLGAAILGAAGTFILVYSALSGLNPIFTAAIAIVLALATAFWFLWAGISAATLGVGLALGGAAAGAAVATAANMQAQMGAYPMGTRALPRTGLFFGHKNEVVYNPSSGRPTQIANDLEGNQPLSTTQEINVNIETLNTKADIDDLDREISKSLRKTAVRSR